MRETLKKHRTRILVWAIILLYLFLAIWFHPEFRSLVRGTIPEGDEYHQAEYAIDGINIVANQEGIYKLTGWVFLKGDQPIDQEKFTRKLVLSSTDDNYIFPTEPAERKDVQETFTDLNMDLNKVGFIGWIKIASLPVGTYKLGFEYRSTQDNTVYYVETNWTIEHTSDGLSLIGPDYFDRLIFKIQELWN